MSYAFFNALSRAAFFCALIATPLAHAGFIGSCQTALRLRLEELRHPVRPAEVQACAANHERLIQWAEQNREVSKNMSYPTSLMESELTLMRELQRELGTGILSPPAHRALAQEFATLHAESVAGGSVDFLKLTRLVDERNALIDPKHIKKLSFMVEAIFSSQKITPIFMPRFTPETLSVPEINDAFAEGVFPIRVARFTEISDNTTMSPGDNSNHDVGHARFLILNYLLTVKETHPNSEAEATRRLLTLRNEVRDFGRSLRKHIRSISDPHTAIAFELFWYNLFHEGNRISRAPELLEDLRNPTRRDVLVPSIQHQIQRGDYQHGLPREVVDITPAELDAALVQFRQYLVDYQATHPSTIPMLRRD